MTTKKHFLGIDFGTSSCSVAVVSDGKVEVIRDEGSNSSLPAYVAFTETGGRLIGKRAKEQVTLNSKNTVFGVKRLIGLRPDKALDETKSLLLPFSTVDDSKNFKIRVSSGQQPLLPEQVAAMMISELKKMADSFVGSDIIDGVITVPTSFNSYQRQAIKDAGVIAGFKRITLLNEPTAVAIDYSEALSANKSERILVLDFGAGHLSATVAVVEKGSVHIEGSSVAKFGTMDIDRMLICHCLDDHPFDKKEIINSNTKAIERLRSTCESNKNFIAYDKALKLKLESFHKEQDLNVCLCQPSMFDEVSNKVSNLLKVTVNCALDKSLSRNQQLDKVFLLGGGTKISFLKKVFESTLKNVIQAHEWDVSPDRVVRGAALYAANIVKDHTVSDVIIKDRLHRAISIYHDTKKTQMQIFSPGFSLPSNTYVWQDSHSNIYERIDDSLFVTVGKGNGAVYYKIDDSGILSFACATNQPHLYFLKYDIDSYIRHERDLQLKQQKEEKRCDLITTLENDCYRLKDVIVKLPSVSAQLSDYLEKIDSIIEWLDTCLYPMEEEINFRVIILEKIQGNVSSFLNNLSPLAQEMSLSSSKLSKDCVGKHRNSETDKHHNSSINLNRSNVPCDGNDQKFSTVESDKRCFNETHDERHLVHHSFGNDCKSYSFPTKIKPHQEFETECDTNSFHDRKNLSLQDEHPVCSDLSASSLNTSISKLKGQNFSSKSAIKNSVEDDIHDVSCSSMKTSENFHAGDSSVLISEDPKLMTSSVSSTSDDHCLKFKSCQADICSDKSHSFMMQTETRDWCKLVHLFEKHAQIPLPLSEYGMVKDDMPNIRSAKCLAVGIDLGTSKCCVSAVVDGKVVVFENSMGSKCTPSYVSFTDTERFIGEAAKGKVIVNTFNTIYGSKGLVNNSGDSKTELSMRHNLVEDDKRNLHFQISYRKEILTLQPKEVNAMLLNKMKTLVEHELNCTVSEAVIAVPSYFSNEQRLETKEAAEIAGLNVLSLVNEPVAATACYKDNRRHIDKQCLLVVDVGAGGTSVAVTIIEGPVIKVLGIGGTSEVSGDEIDRRLMNYFLPKVERKCGQKIGNYMKCMERLRLGCQELKNRLTLLDRYKIQIENICNHVDFELSLSRKQFNEIIKEDFKQKLEHVINNVLKEIEISSSEIDELLLVGGSSRVPLVEQIALASLGKTSINRNVNADEAVACGSAILAANLTNLSSTEVIDDVVNHAFPELVAKRFVVVPKRGLGFILDSEKRAMIVDNFGILYSFESFSSQQKRRTEIISRLSEKLKDFEKDGKELQVLTQSMNDLEAFCLRTKSSLKQRTEHNIVISYCQDTLEWINDCEDISLKDMEDRKSCIDDMLRDLSISTEKVVNESEPEENNSEIFLAQRNSKCPVEFKQDSSVNDVEMTDFCQENDSNTTDEDHANTGDQQLIRSMSRNVSEFNSAIKLSSQSSQIFDRSHPSNLDAKEGSSYRQKEESKGRDVVRRSDRQLFSKNETESKNAGNNFQSDILSNRSDAIETEPYHSCNETAMKHDDSCRRVRCLALKYEQNIANNNSLKENAVRKQPRIKHGHQPYDPSKYRNKSPKQD